jgi:5-formyltetrahydrofolate cyclo-ligase
MKLMNTMDKKLIRSNITKTLSSLSSAAVASQSSNVLSVLLSHPTIKQSRRIGLFMSMDHEIQTLPIIESLISLGKSVYLPHCSSIPEHLRRWPKQRQILQFFRMDTYDDVLRLQPQGKYKLLEPTSGVDVMDDNGFDLIIMPGVGFTKDCYRIGYGAGFYDDYIKRHDLKFNRPYLLGIGLKEQLIGELPIEPHDEQLDCVIVKDEVYYK